MKNLWLLLAGVLVLIWLFFPTIFNWWALNIWNVPSTEIGKLGDLGSLGDIYGSLNTLISSIALCAVAFSTLLQVTSLKETREANDRQIKLAQQAHDAQIRESRYAVFVSMFNGLMSLKQTKLESLKIKNREREYIGFEIFNFLADSFSKSFDNTSNKVYLLSENEVKNYFFRTLKELNGGQKFYDLGSFFLLYENLLNLIYESDLDEKEKEYFKAAVRNSMSGAEQLTLFWMGAYSPKYKLFLKDSQLFSQFYSDKMMPFAIRFHDKSSFSHPTTLTNWDKFVEKQNPT